MPDDRPDEKPTAKILPLKLLAGLRAAEQLALPPALVSLLTGAREYIEALEAARAQDRLFASNRELMLELATRYKATVVVADQTPEKKHDPNGDHSILFWVGSRAHVMGLLANGQHMLTHQINKSEPEEPWTSV